MQICNTGPLNSMEIANMNLKVVRGKKIIDYMAEINQLRLNHFKEFPYLYQGKLEDEQKYVETYSSDPNAMLITLQDGDTVVGINTGIPLTSPSNYLKDVKTVFADAGLTADKYFYFGEIILEKAYQGKGLSRQLFERGEQFAKDCGFSAICFLAVERSDEHPLKPENYINTSVIFNRMGYTKTKLHTSFNWSTIQADNTALEEDNTLFYWIKDLT